MLPLTLSACTAVSAIGVRSSADLGGTAGSGAAACGPCDFEGVRLETWIGRVEGMDEVRLPRGLGAVRLPQQPPCLGWRSAADGFAAAVARRPPGATGRSGSPSCSAPARPAS